MLGIARAQVEVAEPSLAAPVSPLGGEHHQVERVGALHLEPRRPAAAGLVRGLRRFRHHALVPVSNRREEERLCRRRISRHHAGHYEAFRRQLSERGEATGLRLVDHRLAVGVEQVEQHRRERQLLSEALHLQLAPETAHRDLKRIRRAVRPQRDHLAVQDGLASGERPRHLDHLRHGVRHVPQAPGVDAHLVALFVHLDPGPVELVLQRGLTQLRERRVHVLRRLREHRLDRPEQLDPEPREGPRAPGEGRLSHEPQVSGGHHRAPHALAGDPRGAGGRLDRHALQRPLAQLAQHQAGQETLLARRGTGEQVAEQTHLLPRRSRARRIRNALQRPVNLPEFERGGRGAPLGHGLPHGGNADTHATLRQRAGEVDDGGRDLLGRETPKEGGQELDLLQPSAGLGDAFRRLDEVVEPHIEVLGTGDSQRGTQLRGAWFRAAARRLGYDT